jgi:hypothetical protein
MTNQEKGRELDEIEKIIMDEISEHSFYNLPHSEEYNRLISKLNQLLERNGRKAIIK